MPVCDGKSLAKTDLCMWICALILTNNLPLNWITSDWVQLASILKLTSILKLSQFISIVETIQSRWATSAHGKDAEPTGVPYEHLCTR
jgi:hypothetical protein